MQIKSPIKAIYIDFHNIYGINQSPIELKQSAARYRMPMLNLLRHLNKLSSERDTFIGMIKCILLLSMIKR